MAGALAWVSIQLGHSCFLPPTFCVTLDKSLGFPVHKYSMLNENPSQEYMEYHEVLRCYSTSGTSDMHFKQTSPNSTLSYKHNTYGS